MISPLDFPLIKTDYDFAEALLKKLKIDDQDLVIGFPSRFGNAEKSSQQKMGTGKICDLLVKD